MSICQKSTEHQSSIQQLLAGYGWDICLLYLFSLFTQTSKQKETNINEDDMLRVNGTHEGTHPSDIRALQIQKDAQYGRYGNPSGEEAFKKTKEMPDTITNTDINDRAIEKKKTKK